MNKGVQIVMSRFGVDEGTARRALAIAPVGALVPGASDGVTIPTWLFAGMMGLGFGIILGPSIFALSTAGSRRLAELARARVAR